MISLFERKQHGYQTGSGEMQASMPGAVMATDLAIRVLELDHSSTTYTTSCNLRKPSKRIPSQHWMSRYIKIPSSSLTTYSWTLIKPISTSSSGQLAKS